MSTSSESHPHADFVGPLDHGKGERGVNPDRRDDACDRREYPDENGVKPGAHQRAMTQALEIGN